MLKAQFKSNSPYLKTKNFYKLDQFLIEKKKNCDLDEEEEEQLPPPPPQIVNNKIIKNNKKF